MKILPNRVMKAKSSFSSQRETVVTSSFRACSFAMDDGGRCLLDVINDPKLLQSFLESGSDENSKDPQDGTSSESAVESPQVSRSSQPSLHNHLSSAEHLVEHSDQMGYTYALDSQGLIAQSGICSAATGMGGVSVVVASPHQQTFQHPSSSGGTIHHIPATVPHSTTLHPHSPASARSVTPHTSHNIKSPSQGPGSVHSMPPPSPLQQTRSPLPSHTPSPAPAWSPAPPVLSPATSRSQSSVNIQQSHNQILPSSCNVTQFVTALATQPSLTQKLTLQQQQLLLSQQLSAPPQPSAPRITNVSSSVVTTAVNVQPPMVQLIPAPQSSVTLPARTSHSAVRPIQPKLPPQILPKPITCSASNQFATPAPAPKQTTPTPVTSHQRTVGVGIQPSAPSQLVIGQGQPGVFSGPQGTILLNQIIPGVGQSPILIQGNLSNLANLPGLQLTLRPPNSVSPGQQLNSPNPQNNATLIAALQGPSQHTPTIFAPAKSPIHGQQTIVIPNNLAHAGLASQNINLTSAGIPNSGIISSSSQGPGGFLARSNIILSQRLVGSNQSLQLQQIQTPQGPILAFAPSQTIAVPHLQTALQNAALGGAQLAPVTVPMHGMMATGQGVISGLSLQSHAPQSALHQHQQSLFGTAVPFTSHLETSSPHVIQVPQTLTPQQIPAGPLQSQPPPQVDQQSPKPASPPKQSKVPSVNLEELLKEHGIVPENSPVPSPCNSPVIEEQVTSQSISPSPQLIAALQSQQVVLEQSSPHPGLSHLKLAFTQDGNSVILHPQNTLPPNAPRVQHFISTGQLQGRNSATTVGSVIIPTVTTSAVSVPVVTTQSSTSRNHSALIARLNAAPAISVPDVTALSVSSPGITASTSITTTTITTTTTTLVPLTVQSLNVNSSPITNSYVVQRTNILPSGDRILITEDYHPPPGQVASMISGGPVQSVTNHANPGFQTLIVQNDVIKSASQNTQKTSQSPKVVSSTTSSQPPELPKCGHIETHVVEFVDNGAIVPSHNHPSFSSNVPNQMLQQLQKEINDLLVLKHRTPEQQKALHHMIAVQQKVAPPSSSGKTIRANRVNQVQVRVDTDVEKLTSRSQSTTSTVSEATSTHSSQLQIKTPSTVQQSGPSEKNQNSTSKSANSPNVHLVNLLTKQNSPHAPIVKHIAVSTATVTTVCDSTTITTAPTVVTQPKTHQTVAASQARLQIPHSSVKSTNETTHPQVIVKLSKPTTTSAQSSPNIIQLKTASPVKRIVNTVPKSVLINDVLTKHQNAVTNPNVKHPFLSKSDACRRLLAYHVYNSKTPSANEIHKADESFNVVSAQMLDRAQFLKNKYKLLQLRESMRLCSTPELVMMERLFLESEKTLFQADKDAVAEGKPLDLPPLPAKHIIESKFSCRDPLSDPSSEVEVSIKQEKIDPDYREPSDPPVVDDSDPLYKEDDNLEAPVIDSCADIVLPHHDDDCERSPPTLKRIVMKPDRCSESDEEFAPKKRLRYNNSIMRQEDKMSIDRGEQSPRLGIGKYHDGRSNDVFSRLDMVSELRKELVSPMEMDDEDFVSSNHLADFEPPVARTEECDPALLYNRTNNCTVKYDFDLLSCSEWTDNYVHQTQSNESDVAVETIVGNHANASDLDLSGLDGLDDHLDSSQHCSIPNGIQDDPASAESELNYIEYRIPKNNKRYSTVQSCQDQVQNAIKSIIGTDTRAYFDNTDFLPLNRHNMHVPDYVGMNLDVAASSSQREPDLDEAVRSILL